MWGKEGGGGSGLGGGKKKRAGRCNFNGAKGKNMEIERGNFSAQKNFHYSLVQGGGNYF